MDRSDRSFIERAVREHSDMVYRIACHNVPSAEDAKDVVQEVFLRLVRRGDKAFESREHLKAWLIRATLHVAADKRKTDARWRKCCAVGPRLPGARDEEVRQALSELDADDRNVVYLYYYEGYKLREIAGLVGLPENTVSSRLSRARPAGKNSGRGGRRSCVREANTPILWTRRSRTKSSRPS